MAKNMRVIRHRSLSMPSVTGPWRPILSLGLVIAYLLLVGDAMHCQYSSVSHDHHGAPQSQASEDATNCLVANHGAAALPAIAPSGSPSLHAIEHIHYDDRLVALSTTLGSTLSRAPPPL